MRRWGIVFFFFLAFGLCAGRAVIVCTADLHGEGKRFARLAPAIRRENPDLLIDAGDVFAQNFESVADGGRAMMRAFRQMHYRIFVPGNHDFDLGLTHLGEWTASFDGEILGQWHSGKVPRIKLWTSLKVKDLHVAVIGLGEPGQTERFLPGDDFAQISYDEALDKAVCEIRAAGSDLVVLVCHRGLYGKEGALSDLLKRHPGIDLVFGAHTHQSVPGICLADSFYVQSGAHAANAACAFVTYDDATKKIVQIESSLLEACENGSDAELDRIFAEQTRETQSWGDIPEIPYPEQLALPHPGTIDTGFVHFAAEAMRRETGSDAALYDGYADERILSPPVTRRKIFALSPHCSIIIVADLTQAELRGVMEEMIGESTLSSPGYVPGFAGIDYAARRKKLRSLDVPEKCSVALSKFRFCRSRALASLRKDPSRWRDTGLSEQEAIFREFLRRAGK